MDEVIYNKIYARANANGVVTHIFSEAFEKPLENDVCIDEASTARHGAQKYKVFDEHYFYNYEIKDGVFKERDKSADFARLKEEELNTRYIPTVGDSILVFANEYLKRNPPQTVSIKLAVSGIYKQWEAGKYSAGDIRNHAGQTWECHQAHDNATYPDINPNNPQVWANFWRPLHGTSGESARPWVKPWAGTTDMYRASEYMVWTDGKIKKALRDTVYSPEEAPQDWEDIT